MAVDLNAAFLDHIGNPLHVLHPLNASRNETVRGMRPEGVPVDDSGRAKFVSQHFGRNPVSLLETLGLGQQNCLLIGQ
ncbi:hypothetical protein, partial [Gluconobacter sp.]|uniref:hypothetical protein n=1 Tax=Gluconobacter sp. TaxID=1876758 RepID=UPI0039EAE403